MPSLAGIRYRLRLIGAALSAPFDKLYCYPQTSTGLFDFLGPLFSNLPAVPADLAAAPLPDDLGAKVIRSSEPEVARTLYVLARLLSATRIVEVGVYRGATSRFLARALADCRGGTLHQVDLCPEALATARATVGQLPRVQLISHRGLSTAPKVLAAVPEGCDLVYLDADHSEHGVESELRCWLPKVRPGGLISIHDTINVPGVCRAVHRYADSHRTLTMATGRGSGITLIQG